MAKNGNSEYRRALGLIEIGVNHALSGTPDSARTVLRAAFTDGQLHRPERLAGRLQHVAAVTLVSLLQREVAPTEAAATLRKVLRDAERVSERDRPGVIARCNQAMALLPHVGDIKKALGKVKKHQLQRDYVKAFTQLRAARRICATYRDLTPPEVIQSISTAGDEAMTHILENHHHLTAMEIVNNLTAQGLIDTQ